MIELENLSKSFDGGKTFAVQDISLCVEDAETLVFLGTSGSGKTTTLKMINRLLNLTSGSIKVDNRNIMEMDPVQLRRSIGYVFQDIGLFPHLTVLQNVEMIPRLLGWSPEKRRGRVEFLMELMGLPFHAYAFKFPIELSGGQQQRIGVARALAADPAYLLMDEPFGALDALTRDSLQKDFLELKAQIKRTIIFVTHDIFEALTLADRIAVYNEGRMEQIGAGRELLTNPASRFVKDLFSKPLKQLAEFRDLL